MESITLPIRGVRESDSNSCVMIVSARMTYHNAKSAILKSYATPHAETSRTHLRVLEELCDHALGVRLSRFGDDSHVTLPHAARDGGEHEHGRQHCAIGCIS